MSDLGPITKILRITVGAKPQMGPILTTPIRIEVQTPAGQKVLEISQTAAFELVAELSKHLRARDFL